MRWRRLLAWMTAGLFGLVGLAFVALQTGPGQRVLAAMVSSKELAVSGLDGFFPTDLRIAKLTMSDRDGAWLAVDQARLSWSFASLLSGRLEVEELAAERIDVLRPPGPSESPPKSSGAGINLPVGVDLLSLSVADLHVGAPLGGVESHWKVAGSALLAADRTQSRLKLEMNRSDGPVGHLGADIGFDLDRFNVDGQVLAEESTKGGVVATLIGRPDLDKVTLKLAIKGDRAAGAGEFTATAGDAVTSGGSAHWQRDAGTTRFSLDLNLVGPGLPNGPIGRLLRSPATLKGEAVLDDAGVLTVRKATLTAGPAKRGRWPISRPASPGAMPMRPSQPSCQASTPGCKVLPP